MLVIVIQWVHVLLGMFWFGGEMYLNFVVVPVILKLPLGQQRDITAPLGVQANKFTPIAAILVILLGLLRGTVLGPIHSFDFLLGTAYGLTFLVSLLAACAVELWGFFGVARAAKRLSTFPIEEVAKTGSAVARAFNAQVQRVKLLIASQLFGFLLVFTCMILMRFGL